MNKHRIKELFVSLPIDTGLAKREFLKVSGMNKMKLSRIMSNPHYRISASDALIFADFFCIDTKQLYSNGKDVMKIVDEIMNSCNVLKSLVTYDLETRPEPPRSEMVLRATDGVRESRA
jgi:hypothetical protein